MENIICKNKPIRMCVVCRNRFLQEELKRLQCKKGELLEFSKEGRSFYVCNECVKTKNFIKYISKICNTNKEQAKLKIENIN